MQEPLSILSLSTKASFFFYPPGDKEHYLCFSAAVYECPRAFLTLPLFLTYCYFYTGHTKTNRRDFGW